MKWLPLPFAGGSYADDSRPWSHQDTVNYIPVKAERSGTRSPMLLRPVPGMRVLCSTGTSGHRGAHDVEGRSFVVAGTTLYQISTAGVATACGTIPGTGRVSMAHNQQALGYQLLIATGSSGYIYDTNANTLTQITDDAFTGFVQVVYLNQYFAGIAPDRKRWYHSELADGLSYNSLDSYDAESSPDGMVGIADTHGQLLVLSQRSGEFFDNIVDLNSPTAAAFQRSQGTAMERGCAGWATIAKIDNSVLFVGDDGVVYRVDGYSPVRVSTHAIEQALSRCNLSNAYAFTYESKGHAVYYLNCPDGQCWGYDVSTQEWHRRKSYGLDHWRIATLWRSAGVWYAGDAYDGRIYTLDWNYMLDGCDALERSRTFQVMHSEQNRIAIPALEVVVDTGGEESVPHDGATISGALPDGAQGDTVSYQYTITRAYPGQEITIVIDAGALPTGLSIDDNGLVTGPITASGVFTWSFILTDECGNQDTLTDSATISPYVSQGAQLSGWRYYQTTLADATDYSPSGFDDSAWNLGTAPFGDLSLNPGTGTAAHAADSRLSTTIATTTNFDQRLWLRRTFTIPHVPPSGYSLTGYFDNSYTLYVNGVSVASGSASAVIATTINASHFVAGVNHIAARCDDDAIHSGSDAVYYDFLLDAL